MDLKGGYSEPREGSGQPGPGSDEAVRRPGPVQEERGGGGTEAGGEQENGLQSMKELQRGIRNGGQSVR